MPKEKYEYIGNCVSLNGDKINEMKDKSRNVTWKTFLKYVSIKDVKECFPGYEWRGGGLHIKDDYAVSFCKSFYNGIPCYYICWSTIEFVWTKPNKGKDE